MRMARVSRGTNPTPRNAYPLPASVVRLVYRVLAQHHNILKKPSPLQRISFHLDKVNLMHIPIDPIHPLNYNVTIQRAIPRVFGPYLYPARSLPRIGQ